MRIARGGLAAGVINGKLYALGGQDASGDLLDVVECYDPAMNAWTTKSPMPTPRTRFVAVVVGARLYAIGGLGVQGGRASALAAVEQYDPATDTWTAKNSLPGGKYDFAAGLVNGRICA